MRALESKREYTQGNPFRKRLADRLARQGGQYAAPGVESDRSIQREELAVALEREHREMKDNNEDVSPW